MFWQSNNSNHSKQLFFKKPFNERYTLTVKADILLGSIPIKTITEIRWNVCINKVTNEEADIEIITLDNNLLETNNPSLKDLARMNQAFARMYSELHLVVDRKGLVKQIKNIDLIKKKWANTKAEMEAIDKHSDAIKGIVILNDEIFTSTPKMVQAIQSNEFFSIYFNHVYGRTLPTTTELITKWNHFQMAEVQWQYQVVPSSLAENLNVNINITGNVINRLNNEWIKKAYGGFPNIDTSQLNPKLKEEGKYIIDPSSGKLIEAYLLKEEIAHPQFLYSKVEYTLKSNHSEYQNSKHPTQKQNLEKRPSFLID